MRVHSISPSVSISTQNRVKKTNFNQVQSSNIGRFKVISMSEYMASPLSFKGRNKEQAIFYGAEVAPYSKAGGVGVVMKDYGFLLDPKDEVVVSPYYRADVNKVTGEVTPKKDDEGNYILETGGGNKILDLVAEKNMQWGDKPNNKIMLFSLREEKDKIHYFVFDDATAHYQKPYAGGQVYASGSKAKTNAWNGDPYAKNSKAFVELLPELIKSKEGFNPATIVCSDSQTAYTHEYMVQKAVSNDADYSEIKTTHVGHNLGPGYCGETSMQNMFVNLGATPKQIDMIEKDPVYKQNLLGDNYFRPFVEQTLDETGTASATQIALKHAQNGFVKSFSVVAEDYADAIATNPQAAYNIHETAKGLYQTGVFNGILNPLEDPSVDATKILPNVRYNENCTDTDGRVFEAFETFPVNASYEEMRAIKNRNKLRLLQRLSAKDLTIVTGTPGKTAKVNPEAKDIYSGPVIREDLMQMIADGKGEQVPLFVSWGRIDTQKGHDISLSAFEKFAKTKEGKNAIFILGAGLDNGDEAKRVEEKVKSMLSDPELQGRIVHIDGWAPAYALSSAGDAAVFTSRFEPCGLTDIEAMKYYCSPIVTNTQGFKQKNFDPRNPSEAKKATSYKTTHEFDLLKSQVQPIIDGYVNGDEEAKNAVKAEYPIFWKTKDGQKVYDDSAFVKFAEEYSEFIGAKEKELRLDNPNGDLPEGWNDWDNLSKNYSFKYTGFARDLKDTILSEETAAAIKEYTGANKKTKTLLFNNLKSLQTGWRNNQVLHPTNKSSYELYKERHMMADYKKPQKSHVIAKADKFIEEKIESRQKTDLKDRVSTYVLGALTGLGAILLKRTGETTKLEGQLKAQIQELEQKLATQDIARTQLEQKFRNETSKLMKKGRNNMIIAGVIAAVGAAGITFIATKKFLEKKKKVTTNATATPAATTTSPAASPTYSHVQKREPQNLLAAKTTPIKTPQKSFTDSGNGLFSDFSKVG